MAKKRKKDPPDEIEWEPADVVPGLPTAANVRGGTTNAKSHAVNPHHDISQEEAFATIEVRDASGKLIDPSKIKLDPDWWAHMKDPDKELPA